MCIMVVDVFSFRFSFRCFVDVSVGGRRKDGRTAIKKGGADCRIPANENTIHPFVPSNKRRYELERAAGILDQNLLTNKKRRDIQKSNKVPF